jgi:hypothetical protein
VFANVGWSGNGYLLDFLNMATYHACVEAPAGTASLEKLIFDRGACYEFRTVKDPK